ncbi:MAG: HAMP domain-containing protein [Deltaproteobacteria bacterium]|nr:MAG: HAMP domain-containing protein [Deltaproteobacteria bacterium]
MAEAKTSRLGIFQKILLTTLIVSLVPLTLIWLVEHRTTSSLAQQQAEQQLKGFSRQLATHVDDWLDMNQRLLRQNAALAAMRSMDAGLQNPVLKEISRTYDWIYLAFTIDTRGRNIGRSDGKATKFYGDRLYFRQVMEGAPLGRQVLIGKTSGKPALVLSVPILDGTGRIQGVLAIAMTLTDLSQTITEASIGRTGYAFLLDETGNVIAHRSKKFTSSRANFSRHPVFIASKTSTSGLQTFTDSDGRETIAAMQTTRNGWVLIARQDAIEAFEPVRQATTQAVILLVVTLVAVVAISWMVSQRLATPIRKLTAAADQLSKGKLDVEISGTERKDEIGDMARAVQRLGVSIRYAINRLKKG